MIRRALVLVSALGVLFVQATALAQALTIVVDGADFRPFPIAAPKPVVLQAPATVSAKLVRDVSETLHSDIHLARVLELVPPRSYLETADDTWLRPKFANWSNVGASGLVRVAFDATDTQVSLKCRFYDVVTHREVLNRKYDVAVDKAAQAVHRCMDDVVQALTGERGVFSTKITYVRRTEQGRAVYVADFDGANPERLTQPSVISLLPRWDPSGQHVLFTSYMKDNPDLWRVRVADRHFEWLSKKRGLNTGAAVSPDGKSIALTLSIDGNTEIYRMDWNGENLRRLTDSWGPDLSASWSSDGKQIAFVSARSGQPHLYVMSADGSGQRRVTFQGNYNQEPSWSPRPGGPIAFTARDEFLNYDIFLVDSGSGALTRLTQGQGAHNESPTFSPDGLQILFTSDRPPQTGKKLYVMDVDGRNQRRISRDNGDYETPAWGPRLKWAL